MKNSNDTIGNETRGLPAQFLKPMRQRISPTRATPLSVQSRIECKEMYIRTAEHSLISTRSFYTLSK
jgi:hypothetical protein